MTHTQRAPRVRGATARASPRTRKFRPFTRLQKIFHRDFRRLNFFATDRYGTATHNPIDRASKALRAPPHTRPNEPPKRPCLRLQERCPPLQRPRSGPPGHHRAARMPARGRHAVPKEQIDGRRRGAGRRAPPRHRKQPARRPGQRLRRTSAPGAHPRIASEGAGEERAGLFDAA